MEGRGGWERDGMKAVSPPWCVGTRRPPPVPAALGGQRKRGIKDLPEGLGLLVLQRHQRPPWGPGDGEKKGMVEGDRAPWGHHSPHWHPRGVGDRWPCPGSHHEITLVSQSHVSHFPLSSLLPFPSQKSSPGSSPTGTDTPGSCWDLAGI